MGELQDTLRFCSTPSQSVRPTRVLPIRNSHFHSQVRPVVHFWPVHFCRTLRCPAWRAKQFCAPDFWWRCPAKRGGAKPAPSHSPSRPLTLAWLAHGFHSEHFPLAGHLFLGGSWELLGLSWMVPGHSWDAPGRRGRSQGTPGTPQDAPAAFPGGSWTPRHSCWQTKSHLRATCVWARGRQARPLALPLPALHGGGDKPRPTARRACPKRSPLRLPPQRKPAEPAGEGQGRAPTSWVRQAVCLTHFLLNPKP